MYSTFEVDGEKCLVCNNGVMNELGKLQGVFGAEIDFYKNQVVVAHTDEVTREEISQKLKDLGFNEIKENQSIF
jgi:copper chaperone CopZ